METKMELGDLTKKAIVIGTLSAISAFGGMRYNEYRNAMRPFNVVEKSGVYVLKDKLNVLITQTIINKGRFATPRKKIREILSERNKLYCKLAKEKNGEFQPVLSIEERINDIMKSDLEGFLEFLKTANPNNTSDLKISEKHKYLLDEWCKI